MSFLNEILSKKKELKHSKTVVSSTNGEIWIEDKGSVTRVTKEFAGYVVDLNPDMQMAQVIPRLFLGSQDPTSDEALLQTHGITHILSLGVKAVLFLDEDSLRKETIISKSNIVMKFIPLLDLPEASLDDLFGECFSFIDMALASNGNVFVHCNAGISRSPTVVIAYILLRSQLRKPWASVPEGDHPMTLEEVIDLVKSVRPCVKPNAGFSEQLRKFEKSICSGQSSFC